MADEGIDCFALFGAFMAEERKEKTNEENSGKNVFIIHNN